MEGIVSQDNEERLKRVAGQVTGLAKMLSAAQAGLTEVGRLLVVERLDDLLSEAVTANGPSQRREVLARASEIAARFSRGAGPAKSTEGRSRR